MPKQTPTDAKRPVGVISLIGGYRGTPSPEAIHCSREFNDDKPELFPGSFSMPTSISPLSCLTAPR